MTTDTLSGVLRRIKWRSQEEGNNYCIAELNTGETVLGSAPDSTFIVGQTYLFQGTWKLGKEYQGRREKQFHFSKYTKSEPHTRIALRFYLEKFCPGIGPVLAGRIFDAFGQDAVKILRENPQSVAESVPGISLETAMAAAAELQKNVRDEESRIELTELFAGRQFSSKLPDLVLKKWGVLAPTRIKRDPFCLLVEGFTSCGFARCDKLYVDLGKKPNRLKRLMLFIWNEIQKSTEGHTWHDAGAIIKKLRREAATLEDGKSIFSSADESAKKAIQLGVRSRWLAIRKTAEGTFLADADAAENEAVIADCLAEIVMAKDEPDFAEMLMDEVEVGRMKGELEEELREEEKSIRRSHPLSAEEKAAIGRRTGICQFCHRELTHPESKLRGYGPVCGARNGLPWDGSSGGGNEDEGISRSLIAEFLNG